MFGEQTKLFQNINSQVQNTQIQEIDYDASGNKIRVTDANGLAIISSNEQWAVDFRKAMGYKEDARSANFTSSDKRELLRLFSDFYQYDGLNRVKAHVDKSGLATEYQHDHLGQVLSEAVRYDADNDIIPVVDIQVTKYQRDAFGNELSREVNFASGYTSHVAQDASEVLARQMRSLSRLGLDSLANAIETSDRIPASSTNKSASSVSNINNYFDDWSVVDKQFLAESEGATSTSYTWNSQLASRSDSAGANNQYFYDDAGRLVKHQQLLDDNSNRISEFKYDLAGRVIEEKQSVGDDVLLTQTQSYNSMGWQTQIDAQFAIDVQDLDKGDKYFRQALEYDALGNRKTVTSTQSEQGFGQSDELNEYRAFNYDENGRVITTDTTNDGVSNGTESTYNGFGQLRTRVAGDTTMSFTYNLDGSVREENRTQIIAAQGEEQSRTVTTNLDYEYDAAGQQTYQKSFVSTTYDNNDTESQLNYTRSIYTAAGQQYMQWIDSGDENNFIKFYYDVAGQEAAKSVARRLNDDGSSDTSDYEYLIDTQYQLMGVELKAQSKVIDREQSGLEDANFESAFYGETQFIYDRNGDLTQVIRTQGEGVGAQDHIQRLSYNTKGQVTRKSSVDLSDSYWGLQVAGHFKNDTDHETVFGENRWNNYWEDGAKEFIENVDVSANEQQELYVNDAPLASLNTESTYKTVKLEAVPSEYEAGTVVFQSPVGWVTDTYDTFTLGADETAEALVKRLYGGGFDQLSVDDRLQIIADYQTKINEGDNTVNHYMAKVKSPNQDNYSVTAHALLNEQVSAGNSSRYTVREGDTLQGIAQQLLGSASLWYVLADANGLSGSEALVAGQKIRLPDAATRLAGLNNAQSYTPYNAGSLIGETDPLLSLKATPVPIEASGFWDAVSIALESAVVVVVSSLTKSFGPAVSGFATGAAAGLVNAAIQYARHGEVDWDKAGYAAARGFLAGAFGAGNFGNRYGARIAQQGTRGIMNTMIDASQNGSVSLGGLAGSFVPGSVGSGAGNAVYQIARPFATEVGGNYLDYRLGMGAYDPSKNGGQRPGFQLNSHFTSAILQGSQVIYNGVASAENGDINHGMYRADVARRNVLVAKFGNLGSQVLAGAMRNGKTGALTGLINGAAGFAELPNDYRQIRANSRVSRNVASGFPVAMMGAAVHPTTVEPGEVDWEGNPISSPSAADKVVGAIRGVANRAKAAAYGYYGKANYLVGRVEGLSARYEQERTKVIGDPVEAFFDNVEEEAAAAEGRRPQQLQGMSARRVGRLHGRIEANAEISAGRHAQNIATNVDRLAELDETDRRLIETIRGGSAVLTPRAIAMRQHITNNPNVDPYKIGAQFGIEYGSLSQRQINVAALALGRKYSHAISSLALEDEQDRLARLQRQIVDADGKQVITEREITNQMLFGTLGDMRNAVNVGNAYSGYTHSRGTNYGYLPFELQNGWSRPEFDNITRGDVSKGDVTSEYIRELKSSEKTQKDWQDRIDRANESNDSGYTASDFAQELLKKNQEYRFIAGSVRPKRSTPYERENPMERMKRIADSEGLVSTKDIDFLNTYAEYVTSGRYDAHKGRFLAKQEKWIAREKQRQLLLNGPEDGQTISNRNPFAYFGINQLRGSFGVNISENAYLQWIKGNDKAITREITSEHSSIEGSNWTPESIAFSLESMRLSSLIRGGYVASYTGTEDLRGAAILASLAIADEFRVYERMRGVKLGDPIFLRMSNRYGVVDISSPDKKAEMFTVLRNVNKRLALKDQKLSDIHPRRLFNGEFTDVTSFLTEEVEFNRLNQRLDYLFVKPLMAVFDFTPITKGKLAVEAVLRGTGTAAALDQAHSAWQTYKRGFDNGKSKTFLEEHTGSKIPSQILSTAGAVLDISYAPLSNRTLSKFEKIEKIVFNAAIAALPGSDWMDRARNFSRNGSINIFSGGMKKNLPPSDVRRENETTSQARVKREESLPRRRGLLSLLRGLSEARSAFKAGMKILKSAKTSTTGIRAEIEPVIETSRNAISEPAGSFAVEAMRRADEIERANTKGLIREAAEDEVLFKLDLGEDSNSRVYGQNENLSYKRRKRERGQEPETRIPEDILDDRILSKMHSELPTNLEVVNVTTTNMESRWDKEGNRYVVPVSYTEPLPVVLGRRTGEKQVANYGFDRPLNVQELEQYVEKTLVKHPGEKITVLVGRHGYSSRSGELREYRTLNHGHIAPADSSSIDAAADLDKKFGENPNVSVVDTSKMLRGEIAQKILDAQGVTIVGHCDSAGCVSPRGRTLVDKGTIEDGKRQDAVEFLQGRRKRELARSGVDTISIKSADSKITKASNENTQTEPSKTRSSEKVGKTKGEADSRAIPEYSGTDSVFVGITGIKIPSYGGTSTDRWVDQMQYSHYKRKGGRRVIREQGYDTISSKSWMRKPPLSFSEGSSSFSNGRNILSSKLSDIRFHKKLGPAGNARNPGLIGPTIRVDSLPKDLSLDKRGVYGVMTQPTSHFHDSKKWADWSSGSEVENARRTRLHYHSELRNKRRLASFMLMSGISSERVARRMSHKRNVKRLSYYSEAQLPNIYQRNIEKYGNKYGPSYEQVFTKYGTHEAATRASYRSNNSMDLLTGVAVLKDKRK